MKESFWGLFIIGVGALCVFLIFFFQDVTTTDEQNFNLLKETTEAAMIDSIDLLSYRRDRTIRIDREKFVENFLRRFAESASLSKNYLITIYDVNELPPKVSIKVGSSATGINYSTSEILNFDVINKLDAILETPY